MLGALGNGVDVCYGHAPRWPGTGALGFPPLDELPLGGPFGKATLLEDPDAKREALRAFTEHVAPGRWQDVRPPSEKELKSTTVLAIPLDEVSAKVRTGPPLDDQEDYALPVWAVVLPLELTPGAPLADERLPKEIAVPEYVTGYSRKRG